MDHLTPDQLAQLRRRLEDERAAIARRDRAVRDDAVGTLPPDVGDQQDLAAVETAQINALGLVDRDRARLTAIEDALRRMDDGGYGLCEDTDEPIPFARLWAEPTARLTVAAQELREREQAREDADDQREAY